MRNDNTMRIVRTTGLGAAGWLSASLMAGTRTRTSWRRSQRPP